MGYLISVTVANLNSFTLCKVVHEQLSKLNGFEEEQVVRILERHPEIFSRISVSLCNNNDPNFNSGILSFSLFNILSTYPYVLDDFPEELLCSIVALQAI